ncbi:thiamine pyrophosphate-dependent enzyme [Variovorax robiniae]|uniref:Thiamine pyrophosphate-dependent enzyme n=1 Tax=Variovorax robiniae TaxID=1836199 RepID=A0ABU8XEF0_9BURK
MNTSTLPFTLGSASAALINARHACAPDAVLVSTMSAMFALDMLGETRRRIDSVPLMGGAGGIGLGLSLARPDVPVVVMDGDASLLMELGTLATVAHNGPRRYLHVVVNNGVQFNGATNFPSVNAQPGVDFAAMALAAGYARARRIDNHADWVAALPELLAAEGPSFVDLVVAAERPMVGAQRPQPILPDVQFVRMRMGSRRLAAELAA